MAEKKKLDRPVQSSLEPDRVTDQPPKEPRSAGGLGTRLSSKMKEFEVELALGRVSPDEGRSYQLTY